MSAKRTTHLMRTTCRRGHVRTIRSAVGWFFGSAADFCSHPRCDEAQVITRSVKIGGRWRRVLRSAP